MTNEKRILVLGVGNVLYTDEGIGVRAAEHLQAEYEFSDNVTVMDGGTLGTRLMGPIMESDYLIVCDAVLGDGPPGSIYRLTGEDLRQSLAFKNSMHDTDLVDTLIYCELAGNRPEAVIIGMEPEDYQTMATDLSGAADANLPQMIKHVLAEVESAGGTHTMRENKSEEVVYVPRSSC
ncbi:hydrogenase maturation protease [Paucidesulfovibrio gracilis DSM 16080]|uniref:Hydrogenase maturation protease n=1 Tax=Paucidesulfovibrio gracilis DSM 16080 TaxID=1121449 RepID=A0A1T4W3A0_9BACT|nr:HyaD/HybD family hydrogenase maturation endopeptidase [Paucidesulfovibrio gracilis]SKA71693.1 hydrogenase maturation protease [Paucidesulfovibrio gracilis DSM 16080]